MLDGLVEDNRVLLARDITPVPNGTLGYTDPGKFGTDLPDVHTIHWYVDAIGYIRVSTQDQAQEGVSLAAQRNKIQVWCELHDHELIAVQEDAGISGVSAEKRPGLQAALAETCKRKAVLVVYGLSRLARSTLDAIQISDRLQKAGADLVSLSEKIDSTSASGKMIFRLLAVLAEFERDQLAERTKAAMAHLRNQGKRISRHLPFGYDLSADGETLTENGTEQAVIELMRNLRKNELTYRAIAKELETMGIRTKRGRATWQPKVIRDIIKRDGEAAA